MLYKMKLSSIGLLSFAFLLGSCIEEPKPNEQEGWPTGRNVYVAGYEGAEGNSIARLWKNGVVESLVGSDASVLRSTSSRSVICSEARSVYVSGNDVYVAGSEDVMYGDAQIRQSRLWKNGEIQSLSNEAFHGEAIAVFVSDNDVYVLGREAPLSAPDQWALKYWKNGESIIFAQGHSDLYCNSIFVSNGDVYITGGGPKSFVYNTQAKLWKNGVEENLISGTTSSWAYSVFVSDKDVYVAGASRDSPNRPTIVASLWKNGKMEELSDENSSGRALSVCVSGSDVYVAGEDGGKAKLWKNGVPQEIVDDKDARMFISVFVSDNNVYTSGYVTECKPVQGSPLSLCSLKATLWKNGQKLNLNTDNNSDSNAVSVFVK